MQTARAIGVYRKELDQYNSKEPSQTMDDAKAEDFDNPFYLLKERLKESSCREKVYILTVVPNSLSMEHAAEFFNVSEYLTRTARSLKEAKGILADSDSKTGKRIAEYVEAVRLFYDNSEYSRTKPGKKDLVHIGKICTSRKASFVKP